MKYFASFIILASSFGYSQAPGYHQHDGFFLSMNLGGGRGSIDLAATGAPYNKASFSGGGGHLEIKIGGAITENLILSGEAAAKSFTLAAITVRMTGPPIVD